MIGRRIRSPVEPSQTRPSCCEFIFQVHGCVHRPAPTFFRKPKHFRKRWINPVILALRRNRVGGEKSRRSIKKSRLEVEPTFFDCDVWMTLPSREDLFLSRPHRVFDRLYDHISLLQRCHLSSSHWHDVSGTGDGTLHLDMPDGMNIVSNLTVNRQCRTFA